MMYNLQLDTFICVVEAGSFSKAAEELYISAPAVIKQINSLENSLNLQLFERTHRGLIITEAGKSLYQDAKYLIQYYFIVAIHSVFKSAYSSGYTAFAIWASAFTISSLGIMTEALSM